MTRLTGRHQAGLALVLILTLVFAAQGATAQTSYTLTVSTDKPSYVNGQTIYVAGKVSPSPGPSTAVDLEIINPQGTVVAPGEATVGASTGVYNYTFVAGGTSSWVAGTYMVNATWGAYPPQIFAQVTFTYAPSSTTSSSSSTSSAQASSTSSIATSSTSSTSSSSTVASSTSSTAASSSSTVASSTSSTAASSTSSTKGGGIPEFPFQAALAGFFVVVVVSAYFAMRKSSARVIPAASR